MWSRQSGSLLVDHFGPGLDIWTGTGSVARPSRSPENESDRSYFSSSAISMKVFTYPVNYLNIYQTDWYQLLYGCPWFSGNSFYDGLFFVCSGKNLVPSQSPLWWMDESNRRGSVVFTWIYYRVPVILGLCHLFAHYNLRSLESLQGSSLSAPTDVKDSNNITHKWNILVRRRIKHNHKLPPQCSAQTDMRLQQSVVDE